MSRIKKKQPATKFTKAKERDKKKPWISPVDWFNRHTDFVELFGGFLIKTRHRFNVKSKTEAQDVTLPGHGSTHQLQPDGSIKILVDDLKNNLVEGDIISKFEALTIYQYNRDVVLAENHVRFNLMQNDFPYFMIGVDYIKVIKKKNRYGIEFEKIKGWKKETIKDQHGLEKLKSVPIFDDFTMKPSYLDYKRFIGKDFNLFKPFPHKIDRIENINREKFPLIDGMLNHIFGEQIEQGYLYMKAMFERPDKKLPILVLASKERQTGKTTFLNFLSLLYADNYVKLDPSTLTSDKSYTYFDKNIIGIDESVIDKTDGIERLKTLSTQDEVLVNPKWMQPYTIDFFGKVVMATNKVDDFMRIDDEEIRFWVRRVPLLQDNKPDIMNLIKEEIPAFIGYLVNSMEAIDYNNRGRMVLLEEEIQNDALDTVKKESKSWLAHELLINIDEWFSENENENVLQFTLNDCIFKWFSKNNQVQLKYLRKVLRREILKDEEAGTQNKRYNPKIGARVNDVGVQGKIYEISRDLVQNLLNEPNVTKNSNKSVAQRNVVITSDTEDNEIPF